MKIIFNTYPSAFQCPGGGEIQLMKSKAALEALGHEITLFDQWNTNLHDADVIHHFSVQGGSANLCAYAHSQGIPLVISPILWLSEDTSAYPMGEIQYLFDIANAVCPNSIAETKRFLQHFTTQPEKFITTHNGVDELFMSPVDAALFRNQFNIHDEFILCVGNIEPRKNQHRLVAAAEQIGIPLVLIGHVREQSYFDSAGITESSNTRYLGAIDHHDPLLRSAYQACSTFALPSLLETPGLAALEAGAIGTKIVITKEGATKEYFEDSATYVTPTDVLDIANGLKASLKSCSSADASHIQQFSWSNTASYSQE